MKKKGILQLIDSLDTGGAEVLAVNIANELVNTSYKSHLCSSRKEGILKNNIKKGVPYIFLNKKYKVDLKAILKLRNYIKKNNITIIHAHSSSFFLAFCVKMACPSIAIVWHDHYGISQNLDNRPLLPLKYISFFFKAIISVNEPLKEWATKKLLCKKVYFLNNFPDLNNTTSKTILKGNYGKRIIHLAAFREQKDHFTLIESFFMFSKDNEDWTLHLIGNIVDKDYYKKIVDLINLKELSNKIFIYGACLDILNILKQGSIGVLSSKSEGLPISLLEYGFAKLPVIVTNVGQCSKVITNNKSGFIIEPKNIDVFSEKLNILANSELLKNKFSNYLHDNIKENYSKEAFIKDIITIYQN